LTSCTDVANFFWQRVLPQARKSPNIQTSIQLRQELRKQISRKRTSRKRQWFRLAQTWRCWSTFERICFRSL